MVLKTPMVVLSQAPSLKFLSVSVPDSVPFISKVYCSKGVLSRLHIDAHLFRTSYGTTKDESDMLQARTGLFANFCKCSETYRIYIQLFKKKGYLQKHKFKVNTTILSDILEIRVTVVYC